MSGGGLFSFFFYSTDGLSDLQANDAEKLLLTWDEMERSALIRLLSACPHYLPDEMYKLGSQQGNLLKINTIY